MPLRGLSQLFSKENIMAVTLLRAYAGYASGAIVTLPDSTEAALIAQGLATASITTAAASVVGAPAGYVTQGGNIALMPQAGQSNPVTLQGPAILPCVSLGGAALTAVGTSSVHVAGTMNLTEIFVPYWNTWKGAGVLNGTTVGTDNMLVALYGSNGALIANSAVAGTLSASASTFQNRDFLVPVTLAPGRYFIGVQSNGTTATTNKLVAANGANVMTTSSTGTFGTVPATLTIPTTFTTAVGCVVQLYTV
jgi:hypothetical protein